MRPKKGKSDKLGLTEEISNKIDVALQKNKGYITYRGIKDHLEAEGIELSLSTVFKYCQV